MDNNVDKFIKQQLQEQESCKNRKQRRIEEKQERRLNKHKKNIIMF